MQARWRRVNPDGTADWVPLFQFYWKCKHYPSAMSNFFRHEQCEHGCHVIEPLWHDNGFPILRGETR